MNNDLNYLTCTLVGEAVGEPIEGLVGVGNVIKNRAYQSVKTYKDVCLAPKQFSCWNMDDPNYPRITKLLNDLSSGETITDPFIRQARAVATCIYNGDFRDNTAGAKNYVTRSRYNTAIKRQAEADEWITTMKIGPTLGNHIFLLEAKK